MILGDDLAGYAPGMSGMQWNGECRPGFGSAQWNGECRPGFGGMGEWYDEPYDPYADAAAAQAIDDAQAAADAQAYTNQQAADQQAADDAAAIDQAQAAADAQAYADQQAAAPAYGASYLVTGATSGGGLIANEVLPTYRATSTPQPTATPPASTSSNGLWATIGKLLTPAPAAGGVAMPGQVSTPGYFPSSIPANQYNPATVYRDANGQVVRYVPETTLTGQVVYRPATGTPMGPSRPAAPGQSVSVAGFSGSTGILAIGALVAYALISSKG